MHSNTAATVHRVSFGAMHTLCGVCAQPARAAAASLMRQHTLDGGGAVADGSAERHASTSLTRATPTITRGIVRFERRILRKDSGKDKKGP